MSDFARRFMCGRRQDEEPHEQVIVPPRLEEQARAQQEARDQEQQQIKELFEAIEQCNLVHIKKLKEQLSFKDVKDNHERTPLHILADLKPEEKEVKDKILKQIFMILKEAGCDVNSVDEFGNTPVKLAAEKGCIPVLECLLEENADITLSDKYKQDTALHWAAKNGMCKATELLIKHQPDFINPQNRDKRTPLHLAVQEKHLNIVYLLLLFRADRNLKDNNELTPLDIARRAGSKNIEDLLNKSVGDLYAMQLAKSEKGEYVESDSAGAMSTPDSVPMFTILPAGPINVNYNVKVTDRATAAIGPSAHVKFSGSPLTSLQIQQLLSLSPSSSTSGGPTIPLPSPSSDEGPSASSPSAAPLPPLALSPSTSGSPSASSPAATAPLSPEEMDIPRPPPSAPPVEDDDASSG